MIQLFKISKPQVLVDNENKWTKNLMEQIDKEVLYKNVDEKHKNLYRQVDIKDAVILETNAKCAYCESKILHINYGDIEHIKPKSKFPESSFNWDNLTLACTICNNNKRTYWQEDNSKLLNPYVDDISEHLFAIGSLIVHINNSSRGEITWKKLKLNRIELIEQRSEKILELQNLISQYNKESNIAIKEILRDEITDFVAPDKEFSFTGICYLRAYPSIDIY